MSLLLLLKQSGPPGNAPPVASFTTTPTTATSKLQTISLDGTGSYDPDGTIASYQWTLLSAPAGYTGTFSAPTASTTTFTPSAVP